MRDVFLKKIKTKARKFFTRANWNIFRELFGANLKVRDHNSFLGVLWSALGPIITLAVLYFIFRGRFGQDIRAYPLFLLAGIVCVNYFATATTYMIGVFLLSRDIILDSTVPRETVLISALAVHIYKFFIDLFLCLLLGFFYGVLKLESILLMVPLSVAFIAFSLGVSMILSLIYCFAGDIQHIWMLLTRLFLFVTPVFYTLNKLHPLTQKIIYFGNPLAPFVISFQNLLMGKIAMPVYAHSLLLGGVFFILGYSVFIIIENTAVERA